jgi:hypothetical protein
MVTRGVLAADASWQGGAFVDPRFVLPEPWYTAAEAARRTPCQGSDDLIWHPTPPFAVAILRHRHREARLACKHRVADSLAGNRPDRVDHKAGDVVSRALPDTAGWLVMTRTIGATPPKDDAIRHAPMSTR